MKKEGKNKFNFIKEESGEGEKAPHCCDCALLGYDCVVKHYDKFDDGKGEICEHFVPNIASATVTTETNTEAKTEDKPVSGGRLLGNFDSVAKLPSDAAENDGAIVGTEPYIFKGGKWVVVPRKEFFDGCRKGMKLKVGEGDDEDLEPVLPDDENAERDDEDADVKIYIKKEQLEEFEKRKEARKKMDLLVNSISILSGFALGFLAAFVAERYFDKTSGKKDKQDKDGRK